MLRSSNPSSEDVRVVSAPSMLFRLGSRTSRAVHSRYERRLSALASTTHRANDKNPPAARAEVVVRAFSLILRGSRGDVLRRGNRCPALLQTR